MQSGLRTCDRGFQDSCTKPDGVTPNDRSSFCQNTAGVLGEQRSQCKIHLLWSTCVLGAGGTSRIKAEPVHASRCFLPSGWRQIITHRPDRDTCEEGNKQSLWVKEGLSEQPFLQDPQKPTTRQQAWKVNRSADKTVVCV